MIETALIIGGGILGLFALSAVMREGDQTQADRDDLRGPVTGSAGLTGYEAFAINMPTEPVNYDQGKKSDYQQQQEDFHDTVSAVQQALGTRQGAVSDERIAQLRANDNALVQSFFPEPEPDNSPRPQVYGLPVAALPEYTGDVVEVYSNGELIWVPANDPRAQ